MLSFGAMRAMKRTIDQIKAFEIAKQTITDLRLDIAGSNSGSYGKKVMQAIESSPYKADITYHGRVSETEKIRLMRQAQVIVQTSMKEGWGLTVTEANSQGTVAVVYNVDGLRDSVQNNITGLVVQQNNPQQLANGVVALLKDKKAYSYCRRAAWQWSQEITFEVCYLDFIKSIVLNSIIKTHV